MSDENNISTVLSFRIRKDLYEAVKRKIGNSLSNREFFEKLVENWLSSEEEYLFGTEKYIKEKKEEVEEAIVKLLAEKETSSESERPFWWNFLYFPGKNGGGMP